MKLGNITGSRNSNGNVPNVNFDSGNNKVHVNWYNPDNASDNLRSRSEVSHKQEPKAPFVFNLWIIRI